MGSSRYVNDFESYVVGEYYWDLMPEGGAATSTWIGSLSGKKCVTSIGKSLQSRYLEFFPYGKKTLMAAGYMVIKMAVKPMSSPAYWVDGMYNTASSAWHIEVKWNSGGDAKWYVQIYSAQGSTLLATLNFDVTAGEDPSEIEIRASIYDVIVTIDGETQSHTFATTRTSLGWLKIYLTGDAYYTWFDFLLAQDDIFIEELSEAVNIDGQGVSGMVIKLYDTTLSVPDYEITSGVGGAFDLTGVPDGEYVMAGYDSFGYSFCKLVTVASEHLV